MTDDKPDAWDKNDEEWQAIQEDWKELRSKSPITLVTNRASDLLSQLTLVSAKTAFDLKQYTARKWSHRPIPGEMLSDIISKGIDLFMQKWYDQLRSQDLAGLIEVVLEGQQLSPGEMKGFVQALPQTLLERIQKSSIGTVTGVHALIAFEIHRRRLGVVDYTLLKEGERTKVIFTDPTRNQRVDVFLDESFEVSLDEALGRP